MSRNEAAPDGAFTHKNIEGIRFGICAQPEQIAAAAQAGYDYVELDLNDVLRMDENAYRTMAEQMQACGVYAEVVCGLLPGNVPILGESVSAKRVHAALDQTFELARALGAELALFDCPAERMLPPGVDPAMAWRQLGNFVRMLQSYAADAGLRVALATNPIFPLDGVITRMAWVNLAPEDFELVTHYDNSTFCKPNTRYYEEVLGKLGVKPEECVMVGNSVSEDMAAEKMGVRVFLADEFTENPDNIDASRYPKGSLEQAVDYILGKH